MNASQENFASGTGPTTAIGYVNRHHQRCCGTRRKPGNDHAQFAYKMKCQRTVSGAACGEIYGANGSDIFQRKCPKCQDGAVGIDF